LRARLRTEGRIDALTSQGRLQAWLMSGMPAALGLALHLLDPQAMNPLWTTPEGWAVLALLLVLQVAGILLVRRIACIEV
jgi:tight adherence protein B